MNERIAKLYDQAIAIEDGGDYVCGELDPVKFAELIVRECCQVLEHTQTALDRHKWPTPGDCGVYIKEHFGVEE